MVLLGICGSVEKENPVLDVGSTALIIGIAAICCNFCTAALGQESAVDEMRKAEAVLENAEG